MNNENLNGNKRMNHLPEDVNMLFSFINMKLRDEYHSLEDLCLSMDIDQDWITQKLKKGGFEYNEQLNKFW